MSNDKGSTGNDKYFPICHWPVCTGKDLGLYTKKAPAMTYCPIPKDSIVSADQFHGSVRNGKMWFLIAQITETMLIIT